MRPQADVKSAPYRKNKQLARRSQTADDPARACKNGNAPQIPHAALKKPLPAIRLQMLNLWLTDLRTIVTVTALLKQSSSPSDA